LRGLLAVLSDAATATSPPRR